MKLLHKISFIGLIFWLTSASYARDPLTLHVLFTNDIHGAIQSGQAWFMNPSYPPDLGGGAAMYQYVKETRELAAKNGEAVILIDAGNFFQGTNIGMADSGRTMMDWMNKMAYDALVPGTQDFIMGSENLADLARKANFSFVSANLTGLSQNITPYTIVEQQGVKIAIVGLTTAALKSQLLPWKTESVNALSEVDIARMTVEKLKSKGVEIIIGLGHLGVPYNRDQEFDDFSSELLQEGDEAETWKDGLNALEFAHFFDGFSAIFSGGTNAGYNTPWEDPLTHTLVYQGYGNGSNMGHAILKFDVKTGQLLSAETPTYRGNLVTLTVDDVQPDDAMNEWINKRFNALNIQKLPNKNALKKKASQEITWANEALDKDQFQVPKYGKDDYLEAMTWNMEWFPKANDTTLQAVAEIMMDIGADVYAVQEIGKINEFSKLMTYLPGYNFEITRQSSFFDQAIIYNTKYLTPVGRDEPFADNDYNFAGRPPLKIDFLWKNGDVEELVTIINLHMKCCGDDLPRRKKAAAELHDYLLDYIDAGLDKFIALGDWNDDILDKGIEQSFNVFLNDPENFQWATMRIAADVEMASYPTWPSFLDHILIGPGFFEGFEKDGLVETMDVATWLGSWDNYEAIISDHRPVLLQVPMGK